MKTLLEIKKIFEEENIKLFSAADSTYSSKEILFSGDNDLREFVEYLTFNNIKNVFYYSSNVTEDALIELEWITEDDYGIKAENFKKNAIEYNQLVKRNIGNLITANFFTFHNGILLSVAVESDLVEQIEEDGESALSNLTREYLDEMYFRKMEREQELLNEIEEYREKEKKIKIQKFYNLLEKDEYFKNLTTKDGRILRATELAAGIGIKENKTNIVGYLDVFFTKKKVKKISST
ncbi:hypothetical protein [Peribacillus sp. NPDC097295]|uniref:hypothetical protein n=1 Tax=Peribacillus sp. NPDC097295 TaxID=3364402 RepID=UPI0037F9A1B5